VNSISTAAAIIAAALAVDKPFGDSGTAYPEAFNRRQRHVRWRRKALRRKAFLAGTTARAVGTGCSCNPRRSAARHFFDKLGSGNVLPLPLIAAYGNGAGAQQCSKAKQETINGGE
jgi:hypothetical protein